MDNIFPKIHKEGYKFLAISIFVTLVVAIFSTFLGFIFLILSVWVYYFFRDPDKVIIDNDKYLTSPADGLISQIIDTKGPKEL